MRPMRSYWHWFAGTLWMLLPVGMILLLILMQRPGTFNPHIWRWVRFTSMLPIPGLLWLGWVCPVLEFPYLRFWRPTAPTARLSMIGFLYLPAALFAAAVQFMIWGAPLIGYVMDARPFEANLSPAMLGLLIASVLLAVMTWVYHRWYARQYVARCRAQELCVVCGYDLRGNPAGPCPECGATVSDAGRATQAAR